MAIKAGQILFDANGFIVDRIQTGGVTNLNIAQTRIEEVGNFFAVGIVREIPDLTFEVQSLDVTTDVEAIVCGLEPSAVTAGPGGTALDFAGSRPVNVTSPFKAGNFDYTAFQGLVIPYLSLEQVRYQFGVNRANAQETFTLRGDSIYYLPGVPWMDTHTAIGVAAGQTLAFAHGPALLYHESGNSVYALDVDWVDPVSGLFGRLFHGTDYTDNSSGITLLSTPIVLGIPTTATIRVMYGSAASQSWPQNTSAPLSAKPAAVRSKDIDVYLGEGPSQVMTRLTGIQSFDATWKVTLQNDEEFGNPHYTASDFNTADVTGSLGFKGVNPSDFITRVQLLAGVPTGEVAGPLTSPTVPMEARIHHPDTGVLLKTIYVPDATFTMTPVGPRVSQKYESTFNWSSESGDIQVFKGAR